MPNEFTEKIIQVRTQTETDLQNYLNLKAIDQIDLVRVNNCDAFIEAFLVRNRGDVQKSISQLMTCLLWRNSEKINHLTLNSFPNQFEERQFFFYENVDVAGRPILNFCSKNHIKSATVTSSSSSSTALSTPSTSPPASLVATQNGGEEGGGDGEEDTLSSGAAAIPHGSANIKKFIIWRIESHYWPNSFNQSSGSQRRLSHSPQPVSQSGRNNVQDATNNRNGANNSKNITENQPDIAVMTAQAVDHESETAESAHQLKPSNSSSSIASSTSSAGSGNSNSTNSNSNSESGQSLGSATILLDLQGCSLMRSFDSDLIRHLVNTIDRYYPGFLANFLVIDLPWLMNPAMKFIQSGVSEEMKRVIQVVNRDSIKSFIASDQLYEHLGGTRKHIKQANRSETIGLDVSDSTTQSDTFFDTAENSAIGFGSPHAVCSLGSSPSSNDTSVRKRPITMSAEAGNSPFYSSANLLQPQMQQLQQEQLQQQLVSQSAETKSSTRFSISSSGLASASSFSSNLQLIGMTTASRNASVSSPSIASGAAAVGGDATGTQLSESAHIGRWLNVEPANEVVFTRRFVEFESTSLLSEQSSAFSSPTTTDQQNAFEVQQIRLFNPNQSERVVFKMRLNKPNEFRIKPNSGCVCPRGLFTVNIRPIIANNNTNNSTAAAANQGTSTQLNGQSAQQTSPNSASSPKLQLLALGGFADTEITPQEAAERLNKAIEENSELVMDHKLALTFEKNGDRRSRLEEEATGLRGAEEDRGEGVSISRKDYQQLMKRVRRLDAASWNQLYLQLLNVMLSAVLLVGFFVFWAFPARH